MSSAAPGDGREDHQSHAADDGHTNQQHDSQHEHRHFQHQHLHQQQLHHQQGHGHAQRISLKKKDDGSIWVCIGNAEFPTVTRHGPQGLEHVAQLPNGQAMVIRQNVSMHHQQQHQQQQRKREPKYQLECPPPRIERVTAHSVFVSWVAPRLVRQPLETEHDSDVVDDSEFPPERPVSDAEYTLEVHRPLLANSKGKAKKKDKSATLFEAVVTTTQLRHALTGLAPNEPVDVRVVARAAEQEKTSETITATTDFKPPLQPPPPVAAGRRPTNITLKLNTYANAPVPTEADLTEEAVIEGSTVDCTNLASATLGQASLHPHIWSGGVSVERYMLEWDRGQGDEFVQLFAGDANRHKVDQLEQGKAYRFRLTVSTSAGTSSPSTIAIISTAADKPARPEPPTLANATSTSLTIAWSQPDSRGSDVTEYMLELDDPSSGYGFQPHYVGPQLQYTVTGLSHRTAYAVRVIATNAEGRSQPSQPVTFETAPDAPRQPAPPCAVSKPEPYSLTITFAPPKDDGGSQVVAYRLQMDQGSRAHGQTRGGQRVSGSTEQEQDGESDQLTFTTVYEGSDTTATVNNLTPGRVYQFRVSCSNTAGFGPFSQAARIATAPVLPCEPSSLCVFENNLKAYTATLSWRPPADDGGADVKKYRLHVVQGSSVELQQQSQDKAEALDTRVETEPQTGWSSLVLDTEHTIQPLAGLHPATRYAARVACKTRAGWSLFSDAFEFNTPAAPPLAPCNVRHVPSKSALAASTSLTLTWDELNLLGGAFQGYHVRVRTSSAPPTPWKDVEATDVTQSTLTIAKLEPASQYDVSVAVITDAGQSGFSEPVKLETAPGVPATITTLNATASGPDSIHLRWQAPLDFGSAISSYRLEWFAAKSPGETKTLVMNSPEDIAACGQTISSLMPATTYRFRIQASNSVGWSSFSNHISCTTHALPPPAPAIDITSVAHNSAKLKWSVADEDKDILETQLLYLPASRADSVQGGQVSEWPADRDPTLETHVTSVTKSRSTRLSKLRSTSDYTIWIRCRNHVGWGATSSSSFRTEEAPAAAPPRLVAMPWSASEAVQKATATNPSTKSSVRLQASQQLRFMFSQQRYEGPQYALELRAVSTLSQGSVSIREGQFGDSQSSKPEDDKVTTSSATTSSMEEPSLQQPANDASSTASVRSVDVTTDFATVVEVTPREASAESVYVRVSGLVPGGSYEARVRPILNDGTLGLPSPVTTISVLSDASQPGNAQQGSQASKAAGTSKPKRRRATRTRSSAEDASQTGELSEGSDSSEDESQASAAAEAVRRRTKPRRQLDLGIDARLLSAAVAIMVIALFVALAIRTER